MDAEGAAVCGVAFAADEAGLLAALHEPGQRLLGQTRRAGQLADAQPVLLEQRDQHRAERRPHVAEAALRETVDQQAVEVLRGDREQEANVGTRHVLNSTDHVLLVKLAADAPVVSWRVEVGEFLRVADAVDGVDAGPVGLQRDDGHRAPEQVDDDAEAAVDADRRERGV